MYCASNAINNLHPGKFMCLHHKAICRNSVVQQSYHLNQLMFGAEKGK
jgi:hypothetical protein